MWRNPLTTMTIPLSPLLLVPCALLLLISSPGANAVVHTEGGSFIRPDSDQYPSPYVPGDEFDGDEADVIQLVQPPRHTPSGQRQLANIVDELSLARNEPGPLSALDGEEPVPLEALIEAAQQQRIRDRNARESDNLSYLGRSVSPAASESEGVAELERFGEELRELQGSIDRQRQQASDAASSMPVYEPQPVDIVDEELPKKTTAKGTKKERVDTTAARKQKKGEEEFVEYVNKAASNKLRNVEYLEKRVAVGSRVRNDDSRMFGLITSSGNILFVAFVVMCCALTVVGVVGGTYYYRHIREEREDPFDDFTRYSPAGPGKQLKKGPLGNFVSEKGDDALAYRAQLHHYQQSKQKIIGAGDDVLGSPNAGGLNGRDGIAGPVDDDTDKSEDEGEYSVYECPGLAPTGDIEVQNPNFVDSASTKSQRATSPHTSPVKRS